VCEMRSPFDIPPGQQFCLDAWIVPIKLPMRGALLIQVAPDYRVRPGSIGRRGKQGSALIVGALGIARNPLSEKDLSLWPLAFSRRLPYHSYHCNHPQMRL
jgi:hypothetical protein